MLHSHLNIGGLLVRLLLSLPLSTGIAHAAVQSNQDKSHSSLTFFLENDIFASTDEQYTHGCGITWMSGEFTSVDRTPPLTKPFFKILSFLGSTGVHRNYSLSLRQDIYTPKDISDTNLIENDIPYAGITFFPIGFYEKSSRSFSLLELDIGLIGPHSYAGKSQETIHKQLGNQEARGWNNQLKDEIILNLKFVRRWRAYRSSARGRIQVEFLPHIGSGIGTMKTYLSGGAQFRIGLPLPNDFGSDVTQPSCECPASPDGKTMRDPRQFPRFLVYAFGILDGQFVLRDIFLDGNTFRHSHSVNKKIVVGDAVMGIGVQVHRLMLNYLHVFQTKTYETQVEPHKYGSLTISLLF